MRCAKVVLANSTSDFVRKLQRIHEQINHICPSLISIEVVLHDTAPGRTKRLFSSGVVQDHVDGTFLVNRSDVQALGDLSRDQKIKAVSGCGATHDAHTNGCPGIVMPFKDGEWLAGFTLFYVTERSKICADNIDQLLLYAELINQLVISEQRTVMVFKASLLTLMKINNINKSESAGHLQRVSHYSSMIARQVAKKYHLSDEWIEYLFLFAPLHDIGKVFVPERVLFKPGKLSVDEFTAVKLHTSKGGEIVDGLIESFGYGDDQYIGMLRNIVVHHHEAIDGSGYPDALQGDAIPIEARIVAVADVIDALMSKRVYKEAWSIDNTLAEVNGMANSGKLDQELVDVAVASRAQVVDIRERLAA